MRCVDAWGNRAVSSSGYIQNADLTPTALSQFTNNQWIPGSGYTYDGAGNQLSTGSQNSPGTKANVYTYDGENRVLTANVANTGVVNYTYDGEGRRVQKTVGNAVSNLVYDASGQLVAEYFNTQQPVWGTQYVFGDHLGSTRLVTKGTTLKRYDYLPFGEELPSGVGGRGSEYGAQVVVPSTADVVNQKFTGKERDAETGLDFFGARYLSGAEGRFTSPDDPLADQSASDPQSWNLYSYVRNNPLVNIDPSGQDCITTSNQTDKSVTVAVTSGACNGNVGTYVSGTVNTSSLTYNGTSVGYSFTPYDTATPNIGFGFAPLGPSPTSSSDINPFGLAVVQAVGQRANSMYGLMGAFAGGSLIGGAAVAGGLAVSGAGLTSLGLNAARAAAPFLPAVPSALQKLQKIGLTLQQANEIVESPTSQKLIDNANNGNINCIQQVGDKLVRITTDPTGQRIISAGYVRANSIANGLANGRFTAK